MMRRFFAPREIDYDWGALEALKRVSGKKALIVTGPLVQKLGHIARVEAMLKANEIETSVFNETEADPSGETVIKIATLANEFQPDLFIVVGGGSPIDASKAAWAFYENPKLATMPLRDVPRALRRTSFRQKARLIAIPTTSGTGSEVTSAALITDRQADPPVKVFLMSADMAPDIAIIDPELAFTMPPSVTANTGCDALVHSVECFLLTPPSDIVDGLATKAANTILTWLPKAVANGKDRAAREKMHTAATMAGLAFSNGRLDLVHSCAHQIEVAFDIPHGRACALMLNHVLAYLFPFVAARAGELAAALGFQAVSEKEAMEKLIAAIEQLKKDVGIPASIKGIGTVDEANFRAKLNKMAANTLASCAAGPTPTDVKRLFLKAWEGAPVEVV
ncbi:MAG: iron-containing alcohol dehydrogenase [Dehalococcoidia bacterium]|nr:iron-containing alcohol dehydrogenase [Dehalococcoidia bacterium]